MIDTHHHPILWWYNNRIGTSLKMNSKLTVTKSNVLIDASYRLNVQAQKLVLACLSKIDSRPDSEPRKEVKLTATEFSDLMGIDINVG